MQLRNSIQVSRPHQSGFPTIVPNFKPVLTIFQNGDPSVCYTMAIYPV